MGAARRLLHSTPLVPALLLLSTFDVAAHPTDVADSGGEWSTTLTLRNDSRRPAKMRARVRLAGHRFWSTPRDARTRGPWVYTDRFELAPGESRELPVVLSLPPDAPPVLVEQQQESKGRGWRWTHRDGNPLLVDTLSRCHRGKGEPVPFRVFAGGPWSPNIGPDSDDYPVLTRAARNEAEWTDLRLRLGFLSPDSWGLEPSLGGAEYYSYDQVVDFAVDQPPDLGDETILAVSSPREQPWENTKFLGIHAVERLDDGTILCTYSYKLRGRPRAGSAYPGILDAGHWLLVAIPRTDAPIEFRRVP